MPPKAFWQKRGGLLMSHEPQGQFAAALLSPDAPVPEGIVDPAGRPAPKRFAVYRNNVTISLIEALKATFPAVEALVGEAFFREMARIFVRAHPPASPLLQEYGADFPAFIASFEPAAQLPFLPDVARIDRAWLDAFHAADATPLDAATLANTSEEALPALRFTAHPATHLLHAQFPVASIWQAARAKQTAAGIDPDAVETALITRPETEVQVTALSRAEGIFFAKIFEGETLGDAAETAFSENSGFDLSRALGILIGSGACQ